MKKLVTLCTILVLIPVLVWAAEKTLTFSWSPYTGDGAESIKDGSVNVYQRDYPDGQYDYTKPVKVVPQTVTDGTSDPSIAEVLITVPDNSLSSYAFVARGVNAEGSSPDSNEVVTSIDLTPLTAISDLVAVYNKTNLSIDFVWTQNDANRVKEWRLYQSETSGGPYTEVDHIVWDGTATTLTSSQSIVPAPGERKVYYFTVVAFSDGLNSGDSNQVQVIVDRRPAPKVINLKVTIR